MNNTVNHCERLKKKEEGGRERGLQTEMTSETSGDQRDSGRVWTAKDFQDATCCLLVLAVSLAGVFPSIFALKFERACRGGGT